MLYVGKNRLMNINVMSDEDSKEIEEEIAAIKSDIDAVKEDVASADSKAAEKTRTIVFDTFLSLYSFIDNNSPTTIDGAEFYANQMRTGDIIRVIEDGVSDFWYEEGAGEEESGIYEYNDTEYSLAVRGEYHDSVIGIIHETAGGADTGELERYVQSAAESAQEAEESAQEAEESAQKINTELSEYVKKTDYASYSEYGVLKINSTYYGLMIHPTNGLGIQKASESDIKGRTSARPIVPENLDNAVKAALSDCKIKWTDEEKTAAKVLLGIFGSDFQTVQNEGEKITLPIGVKSYAQITEIHGMDSDYNIYATYYTAVKNYPIQIKTENGDVIFELPNDLIGKLTDFGIRGNYIYFDNGKAFYHQACRAGGYNDYPEEGETIEHVISDTMTIFKLKEPFVTDISEYITADGIINMGNAEYLTVVPLVTEEKVKDDVVEGTDYEDYHFNFPTVKILVETYGGSL